MRRCIVGRARARTREKRGTAPCRLLDTRAFVPQQPGGSENATWCMAQGMPEVLGRALLHRRLVRDLVGIVLCAVAGSCGICDDRPARTSNVSSRLYTHVPKPSYIAKGVTYLRPVQRRTWGEMVRHH